MINNPISINPSESAKSLLATKSMNKINKGELTKSILLRFNELKENFEAGNIHCLLMAHPFQNISFSLSTRTSRN